MRVEVKEAGIIPPGYGVAYRAFSRLTSVCYPIPLNLVIRAMRNLWFILRVPKPGFLERRDASTYMRARDTILSELQYKIVAARDSGYRAGRIDAEKEYSDKWKVFLNQKETIS